MRQYLYELYRRKDLIFYLVISGLKAQRRNTFLGYFWWLLDPLLGALIYYFVVVVVFRRGGPDYAAHLVVGLMAWRWLSASLSSAARSIVGQASIITQVYLPKFVFPMTATLTGLVNFGFGLVVIALCLSALGFVPGRAILLLPQVVLAQLLFTLALAAVLAYVAAFLRDIEALMNHFLRLLFYASPVIWREDMIPERYHWAIDINPVAQFLRGYRALFIENRSPDALPLLAIGLASAVAALGIAYIYKQNEHRIIKAL